ncbi:Zn-dependent alcohol dehydrogenase [Frankia sp. CiP3]|uniref:Zn-dependent alcohol dehydrogenase n=1 Tax=Frankia sp. CiP3 TaxID=2880971 RepID=UPI001EF6343A|nr:Zn-dependent alcohol dehydrogenase [Frankia sp. CiP3]
MTSTVRAAVLTEAGTGLELSEIVLPDPGPGRVRVRLVAAGVCHSDLSLANGMLRQPLPAVLGHEGAGTVVAVGPGVTRVAVADPVLLNWVPACRECWFCRHGEPYLCERAADASAAPYAALPDGRPLYPGLGTAAFAEETVVPENGVLRLPADVPLAQAAVLGCAVLTGVGAVLTSAKVAAGASVLVIGLGGVGLSVLQGARLAGADPIIAVDVSAAKEELALRLGATHFRLASPALSKEVRALTGGIGVDHAFEVVGKSATIRAAWSATRRGGRTTVVGVGAKDDLVSLSALEIFYSARTLTGCVFGSCDPDRDVPFLLDHARRGSIDLRGLVTAEIGLADVPAAFEAMLRGSGGRSLIRFPAVPPPR